MDYEKLGSFYLGKEYDLERGAPGEGLVLYDAKDLTTHAVCVGMTGSGKTGLCTALLEEAGIDGIPAIAIDPKGDLGNLLLTFPRLDPSDFRPFVDEAEAQRAGRTPDEHAAAAAAAWREGLAASGQDPSRIARLRDAVEISLYTPGGTFGRPLSVLASLRAPASTDDDGLREHVLSTVSGILALLDIDADPVKSREHLLLSRILEERWRARQDLDMGALVAEVQNPPFTRIGVMEIESFFPASDRFKLAMALNALLASPGFAAWVAGEPLDVGRLLHRADGKPRISILSIAHLGDAERMFFVTLLLQEVISWMQQQKGTGSLRALLFMDEILGFLPPVANPPSKAPMLRLLKQARAFGLGLVLATQNPVDLDYKALANAGTWFIGKLQTENDRKRVLEGLRTLASAGNVDPEDLSRTLGALRSRVFLLHDVHEEGPVVFQSRFALSYLRGPLGRDQIRTLAGAGAPAASPAAAGGVAAPAPAAAATPSPSIASKPVLPPGITETWVAAKDPRAPLVYRGALLAKARIHHTATKPVVDFWREVTLLLELPEAGEPEWSDAREVERPSEVTALTGIGYRPLNPAAARPASYATWQKELVSHLVRTGSATVLSCKELGIASEAAESEGSFRARLAQAARELRDREIEKLRAKYAPRIATLADRLQRAERRAESERADLSQRKSDTAISIGATVLGALFGRKLVSAGNVGRAATSLRQAGRLGREKEDIARAEEDAADAKAKLTDLEVELASELGARREDFEPAALTVTSVSVPAKRGDVEVPRFVLAWLPWRDRDGALEPGW